MGFNGDIFVRKVLRGTNVYQVQNRFIKGNSKIPIEIHTCAKMYAAGNNTGNMIKKNKNVQKVAQGLNHFMVLCMLMIIPLVCAVRHL